MLRSPSDKTMAPSGRRIREQIGFGSTLAVSTLSEERREQFARGCRRGEGTGNDLLLGRPQALGHGGDGAEMVEQAVANLGPQCRAGLLDPPARPGARLFEGCTELRDIVPD